MPLTCVYHKTDGMRVVSFNERDDLTATGEWFDHPNCTTNFKGNENDGQIRRTKGKRKRKCASAPTEIGS